MHPGLFRGGLSFGNVFESIGHISIIVEGVLNLRGTDSTYDGGENTWHSVEVVNATSVMQANLLLEPSAKIEEANRRYDTGSSPDGNGTSRVYD